MIPGFSQSTLLDSVLSKRLLKWLPNPPKTLLFRASLFGFSVEKFHRYCDFRGPNVVIVQNSNNITYGGFSVPSWKPQPAEDLYAHGAVILTVSGRGCVVEFVCEQQHNWQIMCS
jgi:hypothetical protein